MSSQRYWGKRVQKVVDKGEFCEVEENMGWSIVNKLKGWEDLSQNEFHIQRGLQSFFLLLQLRLMQFYEIWQKRFFVDEKLKLKCHILENK